MVFRWRTADKLEGLFGSVTVDPTKVYMLVVVFCLLSHQLLLYTEVETMHAVCTYVASSPTQHVQLGTQVQTRTLILYTL